MVEAALAEFDGTLCFISHDRYFVNRVATRVIEIRVGGIVTDFVGNYDYYLWKRARLDEEASAATASTTEKPATAASTGRSTREREREERKTAARESSRRAKEIARLEAEIETAEARMREIDVGLCDPAAHSDHERLRQLTEERQAIEAKLPDLYAQWESSNG